MEATGASGDDERIMSGQVEALALLQGGKADQGVAKLREVAADEAAAPFEFGPPEVPKPSSELLGDVLLKRDKPSEAAVAYRDALARAPGRTLSLQGLAAAQEQSGDAEGARLTKVQIAKYVKAR